MPQLGATAARLLSATLRPYARAMAGVVALLLVAMALRLATPALLGLFVDRAIDGRPVRDLVRLAAAYTAAALVAEVLQLAVVWGSVDLAWKAGNSLRERLAAKASRLDMAWHGRHSPGQLIERIDGDVEALVLFFAQVVVHVLGNALLIVGMLAVAFVIDPRAGLVLLLSALVGGGVMVRLRAAAVPAREAEREVNAQLYGDLEERLGGLEDLRANGAGGYAVHRLHHHSARSWRAARHASLVGDSAYAAAAITMAAGSVVTLALGLALHQRGMVTAGAVLSLFRYSEMLRQPLERIAEQLKEFQKAVAGARRAAHLLGTQTALPDGALGEDALPAGPLEIAFVGVTAEYHPGVAVLNDVRLRVAPGRHLGVVGRTGSGKTTLARLVLRLWDVQAGAVLLGGVDVRDLRNDVLRRSVAVVTQDVELFRATLRDNLTLFGGREADDQRLSAVLEEVGLGAWLAALPHGLDTELEGAQGLSAGEAQLLAFARAFLLDPAVVVLDEASSRLDPSTEARVAAATRRLLAGRTALVIAHRLGTLDAVDDICVVDHGVVVEHGRREVLAADPRSRFARLARLAVGGRTIDEVVA